jgi:hypothetical protein
MSATEIIEQIRALPPSERKTVLGYLTRDSEAEASLYDEFTVLGSDAEGSDVSHAATAQAEIIGHERA